MTTQNNSEERWPLAGASRQLRYALAVVAQVALLGVVACDIDETLDVPDPDVATPGSVQDKTALPAVLAGAVGDFQLAYSGQNSGDGQITIAGLFTDEFIWAETFPTRFEVDVRAIANTNGTMETVFRNLHRARISGSRAAQGYAQLDPTSVAGYAEALNLEGMTYNLFGENYCSGVPFSSVDFNGATTFGDPLTTQQMFEGAVVRFDSALKVVGTSTAAAAVAQANFAKVGKARALLNLNQPAQAAAAVAGVPTAFRYQVLHSENTTRQHNGIFSLVYEGRRFAVPDREGGTGLPFRTDGATDTRVATVRGTGALAFGFDGVTPMWAEAKYPLRTTNVTVADGIEARLIEAEADLRAGGGNWLATLNALRATVSLGPLTDPGSAAARADLLFKERAYWLWLTSHRLGDMRRLVRQYNRTVATVFPTGEYFKGGSYGDDVNFPVPFDEQNNPNFEECIDRNP